MPRFRPLAYLLPALWRTLLARPTTVRYPYEPLELPPYFRGKVTVDLTLCRGCGLCVRDCPAAALELKREGRQEFTLIHYHDRCSYCGQCEESCRHGAIKLTNEIAPAATTCDQLRVEFSKEGE